MSSLDARTADEALAAVKPAPLTPAQRAMQRRESRIRTLARMIAAVTNLVTMSGSVTRRDLIEQGFTEREIDRHFRAALSRARAERMVS